MSLHSTHGPIDVMPDHRHEGRVRELSEIDLSAEVLVDGDNRGAEFPAAADSSQPKPRVIAHGYTLPEPCWSCPPWERLEHLALGGLARAAFDYQDDICKTLKHDKATRQLTLDAVEKHFADGLRNTIELAAKEIVQAADETSKLWSSIAEK